jgi:hypothetical protein
MIRSIHVVRDDGPEELQTRARDLGAEGVEVWRAVEGPPVPPEFRSVAGRSRPWCRYAMRMSHGTAR